MDAATNQRLSPTVKLFPVSGIQGTGAKNLLLGGEEEGGILATFDAIFREITQPTNSPLDRSEPSNQPTASDQQATEQSENSQNSRPESVSQRESEQDDKPEQPENSTPLGTMLPQPVELVSTQEDSKNDEFESTTASLSSEHHDHQENAQPLTVDVKVDRTPSLGEQEEVRPALEKQDDPASEDGVVSHDHEKEEDKKPLENFAAVSMAMQPKQGTARESRTEKKNTDDSGFGKIEVTNQQVASEKSSEKHEVPKEEKLATDTQLVEQNHEKELTLDSQATDDAGDRNARSERLAEIARDGRGDHQESASSKQMQEILAEMEPVDATEYYSDSSPAGTSSSTAIAPPSESVLLNSSIMAAQTAANNTATSASSSVASSNDGGAAPTSALEGTTPSSNRLRTTAQGSNGAGEGTNTTNADRVRLVQRVARAFQKLGDGGGQVHMMLRPSHLGSVRLDLTVTGRSMDATLTAQTDAAVGALRENLGELRSRLEEFGIEIERIEVRKADLSSSSRDSSAEGRNQGSGFQGSGSQNSAGSFKNSGDSREDRGGFGRENSGRNTSRTDAHSPDRSGLSSSGVDQVARTRISSRLDLML